MSRPMSRKARTSNGQHSSGQHSTVAEDPMTSPAPTPEPVATDDALDDILAAYERAKQRAEIAAADLESVEKQIRDGVTYADEQRAVAEASRQCAADLERQAAEAREEAKAADRQADVALQGVDAYAQQREKMQDLAGRHNATANHHLAYIRREVARGAGDPWLRRQRRAAGSSGQPTEPDVPRSPGFPGPSALDAPSPVRLGPGVTHPFPADTGVDATQKTPAGGAP
jgi:hypothetical protein